MFEGKTFLVTGATGRLGTALVQRAEELGAGVVPVVFGGYPDRPRRTSWPARTEPRRILGAEDLRDLPRIDHVLNCHWEVDRGLSAAGQLAFEIERNINRPDFFWEWLARRGPRSFVNVSSIKVFGPLNAGPLMSGTEPRPATPYGIAKIAAESYFDARFGDAGVPVAHLRLCSIMAADGHPTQLTSQILSSLRESRKILINKGHQTHLLPINEAVDILLQAAVAGRGGRFNIVSGGIPNERVAGLFAEMAGRELNAEYRDLQPGTADPVFVSDIDRFRADWVRRIPIEEAIREVLGRDR